jgi:hypothetical protein
MSGYFFLLGFVSSRLNHMPNMLLNTILNVVSLVSYLIGYVSWYLASLYYPEHPPKVEQWFGFAQFRRQYQIAAILGTLATIFYIVSPTLLIPSTWLYFISNALWAISEYHKRENPPEESNYCPERQTSYVKFAIIVTLSALEEALAETLIWLLPLEATCIITIFSIIGTILTLASLYYWYQSAFGNFEKEPISDSYQLFANQLVVHPSSLKRCPTPQPGMHQDHDHIHIQSPSPGFFYTRQSDHETIKDSLNDDNFLQVYYASISCV